MAKKPDVNVRLNGELAALLRALGIPSLTKFVNHVVCERLGANLVEASSAGVGIQALPLRQSAGTNQMWLLVLRKNQVHNEASTSLHTVRCCRLVSVTVSTHVLDVLAVSYEGEPWVWLRAEVDSAQIQDFVEAPVDPSAFVETFQQVCKKWCIPNPGVDPVISQIKRLHHLHPPREALVKLTLKRAPILGRQGGLVLQAPSPGREAFRVVDLELQVRRKPGSPRVPLQGFARVGLGGGASLIPNGLRCRKQDADPEVEWTMLEHEDVALFHYGTALLDTPVLRWPNAVTAEVDSASGSLSIENLLEVECALWLEPMGDPKSPAPPF